MRGPGDEANRCNPINSGELPLDEVPGMGIVLPGGVNMYYLDVAPNTEGTMVSNSSSTCNYSLRRTC